MKKFLTWLWGVEESLNLKAQKIALQENIKCLEWDEEHILEILQAIVLEPTEANIELGKILLQQYNYGGFSRDILLDKTKGV